MLRHTTKAISVSLLALAATVSLTAFAEEPNPVKTSGTQANPNEFDRDGKHICGYNLMTESELGGHRSQLFFTKSMADRDAIRKDQCDRMRKRAQERGVEFKE